MNPFAREPEVFRLCLGFLFGENVERLILRRAICITALAAVLLSFACPIALARQQTPPGGGLALVCLDPGHGGTDSGANYNGVQEKEVNLDIALRARPLIQASGYSVLMTRTTDETLSLQQRCDIANKNNATVFIAIHNNAYTTESQGTETYAYYSSEDGRRLATSIHQEVVKRIKLPDRGVKEAGFYVLKHTDMTSALIEGAFLTNPAEAKMLQDPKFRQKIAEGVAAGIKSYLIDPGRFDEYLLMMNPDTTQTAEVEVSYMNAAGREDFQQVKVAPLSRATIHVDEAEPGQDLSAMVTSTNGVPIVAERAMYFNFEQGRGGHDAPGVTVPSTAWYLAEGSTDWGFRTYVCIQNPTEVDNPTVVRFMRSDGKNFDYSVTLKPRSRFTLDCANVAGLEKADFSVKVLAEAPVVVERAMYFKNHDGKSGGHVSPGVTAPANNWYLAEGFTGKGFDTYVLIQNPNATNASVRVDYLLPKGRVVSVPEEIAPRSRRTIHIDELRGLENTDVSVSVESTVPVVVERSIYFNYFGITEGTNSTGVTAPSTQWYLAEGFTAQGFDTYVLLENPGYEGGAATIEFLKSDGEVKKIAVPVAARSRQTVKANTIDGLGAAEFSTRVTCGVPLVVERSMYFNYQGKFGGHNAMGTTEPALQWYFAEGCTK
jgi:N-acetylmuramoyl-L-alanine amidase